MADKSISSLPAANTISDDDLFVLQQSGLAKKLQGSALMQYVAAKYEAMGYIESIEKVDTEGLVDTYEIRFSGIADPVQFEVRNGERGAKGDTGAAGKNGIDGRDGVDGVDGIAATVSVGTVTTGEPGTMAEVTNTGTSTNAILNFKIPRGNTGSGGSGGGMDDAVYDPQGAVASAGGIPAYVSANAYKKPSTGIPAADLSSAVQQAITKANSALTSITGSDVVSALGYRPYSESNPNGFTSNIGTVTNVKINGETKNPNASGSVDIGTVLTEHQSLAGLLRATDLKNYFVLDGDVLTITLP